jgi:hypothetical protein
MMANLELFLSNVKDFDSLQPSQRIDYFALYLELEEKQEKFTSSEIKACFHKLKLIEYSNINSYLTNHAKRRRGTQKFVRTKSGYYLEGNYKKKLLVSIGKPIEPSPTNNLFSIDLLKNTRGYLQKVAKQAIICYDIQQFDASFVMIRKLLEIIIIECFERHKIDSKIKDKNDDFLYLSDLISALISEKTWNITRNSKQALPKIKKFADLSAHNRRFVATKPDIDSLRDDLRIVIEELLHIVDYENWK